MKRYLVQFMSFIIILPVYAAKDTLYHYNLQANSITYGNAYEEEYARFSPPAPCTLFSLIILLNGDTGDSVKVHIHGHEAGSGIPIMALDLTPPVTLTKTMDGEEPFIIDLPEPLYLPNNQFFVGFTNKTPGLNPVSDNSNKTPECESTNGGNYYYQLLKDGVNWYAKGNAYKIKAIVEYESTTSPKYFSDVTHLAGIDTNLSNATMAWADFNNDYYLDLLVAGTLYKNNKDGTFSDITVSAGIDNKPGTQGNAFIDMDNDGLLDIICVSSVDSTSDTIFIFENNGDETFTKHTVNNSSNYKAYTGFNSFSFADINFDKYPDLFISRLWFKYPDAMPNHFFFNDQQFGLIDTTGMIYPFSWTNRRSRGSLWVDYDNDADLDLYVVNYFLERDELWRNNGNGTFTDVIASKGIDRNSSSSNHGTGVDWADYDNDGDMDLLLPQFAHPQWSMFVDPVNDHRPTTIYRNEGPPSYPFFDTKNEHGIEYEETHAGGAWGDVNNDGLVDIFMSTYYGCRYVDLYLQKEDHSYEMKSFEYGVEKIVTGQDAIWVDYDNDGKLDLTSGKNGQIRLYNNVAPYGGNFAEFELISTSGNHFAIGARIIVYSDGKEYMQEVTAGRGQRMQKPSRTHFGLYLSRTIDSVKVRWPNGTQQWEKFTDIDANTAYRLIEGGQKEVLFSAVVPVHTNEINNLQQTVKVFPNPFIGQVFFQFQLNKKGHVQLEVYSLLGEKTAEIINGYYPSGIHQVVWKNKINGVIQSKAGIYFYKLSCNGKQKSGKLISLPSHLY